MDRLKRRKIRSGKKMYRTCPYCNGNIDSYERCDCRSKDTDAAEDGFMETEKESGAAEAAEHDRRMAGR